MHPCRAGLLICLSLLVAGLLGRGLWGAEAPESLSAAKQRRLPVETAGLRVRVRPGLGGMVDFSLCSQVAVEAVNVGSTVLDGVFELEVLRESGDESPVVSRREVYLVPRGRKQFLLPAVLSTAGFTVRFRAGGQLLYQRHWSHGGSSAAYAYSAVSAEALHVLIVRGAGPSRALLEFARAQPPALTGVKGSFLRPPGQRPVRSLYVAPWEVPRNAPLLMGLHAVVLAPSVRASELDAAQCRALSRYVQWGGVLVVPPAAEELAQRLAAALPSGVQTPRGPAPPAGGWGAWKSVLQGIHAVAPRALYARGEGGDEVRDAFLCRLETRREPCFPSWVQVVSRLRRQLPPSATSSFSWVGALFLGYALLGGPVVLLFLRRKSRRLVAGYVLAMIGVFCLLSAFLGPLLSLRRGDLEWVSVTELTPSGGSEWTLMTATSAGGRAHGFRPAGPETVLYPLPLRLLPTGRGYSYYWRQSAISPLGDLGNLAFVPAPLSHHDASESLPLVPWGQRAVLGHTRRWAWIPLGVECGWDGKELELQVDNTLPLPLFDMTIVYGACCSRPFHEWEDEAIVHDFYGTKRLGSLPPGGKVTWSTPLRFAENHGQTAWNLNEDQRQHALPLRHRGRGGLRPPRLNHDGKAVAWLLARTSVSPPLPVRSEDFVVQEGTHYVVQEIRLPEAVWLELNAAEQAEEGTRPRPGPQPQPRGPQVLRVR